MKNISMHRWGNLPAIEPRREVVEGLLAAGDVCFMTGRPGAGKSALAVALAAAVVSGRPFLRRKTKRRAVVYIAAERGRSIPARFIAAGLPEETHFPDGNPVPLALMQSAPRIIDDLPALIEAIRKTVGHPGLIVIDTLARVTVGLKENDTGDASAVADALARLTEEFTGAAVVILHHLGKDGDFRGSTAYLGAADLELRVVSRSSGMRLRVAKSNHTEEGAELPFRLEPVMLDGGETAIAAVSPPDPTDALRDGNTKRRDEASARALEALQHLPTGSFKVAEIIDPLTDAGVIEGKDRRTRRTKAERLLRKLEQLGKVDEFDGLYTVAREGEV